MKTTDKTAEEILDQYIRLDTELCEQFRDEAYPATTDEIIQYLARRLHLTASSFAQVARKLIDADKKTTGTTPDTQPVNKQPSIDSCGEK